MTQPQLRRRCCRAGDGGKDASADVADLGAGEWVDVKATTGARRRRQASG
jgi:hypothetical protein